MKHFFCTILVLLLSVSCFAQQDSLFVGRYYNAEYKVYLVLDFYRNNVVVPGGEVYGEMSGYFGADEDYRKWLFTSSKIKNATAATAEVINDYGSEDLEISLTAVNDTTLRMEQKSGSTIKIAGNGKWIKIPNKLDFIRK